MNSISFNQVTTWAKKRKVLSVVLGLILISTIWMGFTGTITYPYIMLDRQIQSIRDCTFGSQSFTTDTYGFSFAAPEGYCILPNRLFPLDGSIEVVPKGWYFVFNEYALGTVAGSSRMTFLFEPVMSDRNPQMIIDALVKGGFLDRERVTATTTPSGIPLILVDSALGTDGEPYDWVFTTHPDGKYFLGLVRKHGADEPTWDFVLNSLKLGTSNK